jgi:hypothetical protein
MGSPLYPGLGLSFPHDGRSGIGYARQETAAKKLLLIVDRFRSPRGHSQDLLPETCGSQFK